MDESCPHVFCARDLSQSAVMSHVNDSCLSMNESCHTWNESCPIQMCSARRMHLSLQLCHIWMSHVTHMNKSCHKWNESCSIQMCSARRIDLSSYVTYIRVMSHIWRSHVTHGISHVMYKYVVRAGLILRRVIYGWITSLLNESWHTWMSHIICEFHSYVSKSSYIWNVTEECVLRTGVASACSHVSCRWVTSYMNESCHIYNVTEERVLCTEHALLWRCTCVMWMSHVIYEWVMSHIQRHRRTCSVHRACFSLQSCDIWMSNVTNTFIPLCSKIRVVQIFFFP